MNFEWNPSNNINEMWLSTGQWLTLLLRDSTGLDC